MDGSNLANYLDGDGPYLTGHILASHGLGLIQIKRRDSTMQCIVDEPCQSIISLFGASLCLLGVLETSYTERPTNQPIFQ